MGVIDTKENPLIIFANENFAAMRILIKDPTERKHQIFRLR